MVKLYYHILNKLMDTNRNYLMHRSGPYEIQAEGEKENPLQKLNRLKCEVAELEEELAKNNVHVHSTLLFFFISLI